LSDDGLRQAGCRG